MGLQRNVPVVYGLANSDVDHGTNIDCLDSPNYQKISNQHWTKHQFNKS